MPLLWRFFPVLTKGVYRLLELVGLISQVANGAFLLCRTESCFWSCWPCFWKCDPLFKLGVTDARFQSQTGWSNEPAQTSGKQRKTIKLAKLTMCSLLVFSAFLQPWSLIHWTKSIIDINGRQHGSLESINSNLSLGLYGLFFLLSSLKMIKGHL